MAACNPDIISLCHTVDMTEGIQRAGKQFAYQGNMDAGVLFGSKESIEHGPFGDCSVCESFWSQAHCESWPWYSARNP